jgi:2-amino-4-hydroxy-6-hydroxymethyldihydropteridine diphosphokinase
MTRACVGLGANLGDPQDQIRAALAALGGIPKTQLLKHSSLYRSAPVGNTNQPEFVNAVALIETALAPRALLVALLEIEQRHGRTRSTANAPRTLDLDLLLYGELIIDEPGLAVPHPRMHSRAFVLAPLAEIAPDIEIPGQGAIGPLLAACAGQAVERLDA